MCNQKKPSVTSQLFIAAALTLSAQSVLAGSIILSQYIYEEGDYYITANNGSSISSYQVGGVDFGGRSFSPSTSASGDAGGFVSFDAYTNEHNFSGYASAGATVNDPLGELNTIQIDGDGGATFRFRLLNDHRFTLSGDITLENLASASVSFNALNFTNGDLGASGILAAGDYTFSVDTMALLDSAGVSSAWVDFDLQLQEITTVPLPAAFWLFAAGLTGITGLATRRHRTRP